MDEIIDIQEDHSPDNVVMKLIRWWERMRIPFNILLICTIVFVLFYSQYIRPERTTFRFETLVFSLIYLFIVNLFYCLGWGLPLLLYHYFKVRPTSVGTRIILFILGTLLSLIITLVIFSNLF